ncbi:BTAD domain-containing putative transcriptional regulator [Streptosporangium soli]|nr:tetratricopeptide repeat protein [Streptosporangium sp. KLBMP 9127]
MEFGVLGPLAAERDGQAVHLHGQRQRTILAVLLLEAGRQVPRERLARAVWGEQAPGTARNQVQICVSQLRRKLGDTEQPHRLLVTRGQGYAIMPGEWTLDLAAFDEHVGEALAATREGALRRAVRAFRAGLALWRGPALAGIDSELVRSLAAHLDERRASAVEQCVEAELFLGEHQHVIGELRRVVAADPLRERPHGQLMLALYRCGRQAEALEVYDAYHRTLLTELDEVPGEELRRLRHAIVGQEESLKPRRPVTLTAPSHGPVTAVPHQLPALISPLVGRTEESGLVHRLLAGGVRTAAVVGRSGVGKTALALHAAHRLAGMYGDGQLYMDLRGDAQPAEVLGRFLRALGMTVPHSLADRASVFRSIAADRRILIVLDNAGSDDLLSLLLPPAAEAGVLITSRHEPPGLEREAVVRLDPLDGENAVRFLAHDVGADRVGAEPEAAAALAAQCAGLPLALRVAGARLAAKPHWSVRAMVERLESTRTVLDELTYDDLAVRASLAIGYRDLSPRARMLFHGLGVFGCSLMATWLGAAILDLEPAEAEDAFGELVRASLLERRGSGYGWHDLVRAFAAETAETAESAETAEHTDADGSELTLAITRACATVLYLGEHVHRRLYGGDFTVLRGTAPRRSTDPRVLGDDPLAWFDGERHVLLAAIRQSARLGLSELCWELSMTALTLFENYGYFDDWRAAGELGVRVCAEAGDRRGEGAMLYALGSAGVFQQRYTEARVHLTGAIAAFEEVGDDHGRALALRHIAIVDRMHGDLEAGLERYEQSVPLLRAAGDRAAEAHVLIGMAGIHVERDRPDRARPLLERALRIFREIGIRRGEAQALNRMADMAMKQGDPGAAVENYERALDIVRAMGDRIGRAYVLQGLGEARLALGHVAAAESTLVSAQLLAHAIGERLIEARARLTIGLLYAERGDASAAGHLTAAHAIFTDIGAEALRAKASAAMERRPAS